MLNIDKLIMVLAEPIMHAIYKNDKSNATKAVYSFRDWKL